MSAARGGVARLWVFCDTLRKRGPSAGPDAPTWRHHAQGSFSMSIGIWQVVLVLLIVLILFGAGKLPKVMGDVAKGVKNFKSGMKEDDEDDKRALASDAADEHAAE